MTPTLLVAAGLLLAASSSGESGPEVPAAPAPDSAPDAIAGSEGSEPSSEVAGEESSSEERAAPASPAGTSKRSEPGGGGPPDRDAESVARVEAVGVATMQRSGLFGWGLGLEAPSFGVMTGLASRSQPGAGYSLGGAVSWEAHPRVLLRLSLAVGQTYGGRAGVRYVGNVQTGEATRSGQAAEFLTLDAGLGVAYLFRGVGESWTPLAGLDFGYAFYGYVFDFDDSLEEIEAADLIDTLGHCTDAGCRSPQHDGMMFGPTLGLRGGVRFELTRWLASQVELALTYVRLREEAISHTVESRNVRTAPESLLALRMLFTVRLGL